MCPAKFNKRLVGDPVDVVTGAFVDTIRDFVVASDFPIDFRRTYSTEWVKKDCGFGRGYSHNFDHCLKRTLDGISYVSPFGSKIEFPTADATTNRVVRDGYVLVNKGDSFVLTLPDGLGLTFENKRPESLPSRMRLLEMRSSDGRTIRVGYDPFSTQVRIASLTDCHDKRVSFSWEKGHIVEAHVLSPDGPQFSIVPSWKESTDLAHYFYEGDLLVEVEDAYKHRLHYEYDAAGRLTKRTDRNGYSFFFQYDRDGRCVRSAAEDGLLEVNLEHFPDERRTRVTKGDGGVWEYHYNQFKTLTKIIGPDGVTESFVTRPEDGRIAFEIDGAKNKIDYEYDAEGRLVGKRDELGRPIAEEREHPVPTSPVQYELGRFVRPTETLPEPRFVQTRVPEVSALLVVATASQDAHLHEVRDIQGLLVREERDGLTRRYGYDANGNLRWEIDFDGGRTGYEYSSFNHLIKKFDPNKFVTDFVYSRQDELQAVEDPQRTWTAFPRDLRGNVAGVARGNAWKEGYRRDGAGKLIEKTGAHGQKLYDVKRGPQGEVLERTFASGGFERFEYNYDLRVVKAETASSKCTFAYDYLGNRTKDWRDDKGVQRRFHTGKLTEYRVLDKFVTRYRYAETPYSHNVIITDPTGRTHCIRDQGYGVVTREYASGRKETTQYHPAGHVLVRHVYGSTPKSASWTRRYKYSGEGYLTARFDTQSGPTRYEHDAGHRLLSEQGPDGNKRVFEHDAAGNLTQNGLVYAQYDKNLLVETDGRRFEHDGRQAIWKEQWKGGFRWFHRDEREQLVRIELYGQEEHKWRVNRVWTARYDALNRRIEKNVYGEMTTFYWDTDRLAAEIAPDGKLRIYVYADALAMTPVLFVDYASVDADPASGTVYAVFADHLSCPERIEDMAGKVVWTARIAPYGMAQVVEGQDFHQPMRWPGHYYDAELGLHYNRFRTYSPELGRYYEPDPLGRGGGIENVYAYTQNPLFRVDTHGLACPFAPGAKKPGEGEPQAQGEPPGAKPGEENTGEPANKPKTAEEDVPRDLHAEAIVARDALAAELAQQRHPPATVVGAYSESTGQVTAGASRGGGLGCAEGVCNEALGHPPDIQFTPAIRPRTMQPVDVCSNCETTYGRNAFPDPTTRFQSDQEN